MPDMQDVDDGNGNGDGGYQSRHRPDNDGSAKFQNDRVKRRG